MPSVPDPQGQDDLDEPPFAEINVTPLVDVMLVLLVIFIMAAPSMMRAVLSIHFCMNRDHSSPASDTVARASYPARDTPLWAPNPSKKKLIPARQKSYLSEGAWSD